VEWCRLGAARTLLSSSTVRKKSHTVKLGVAEREGTQGQTPVGRVDGGGRGRPSANKKGAITQRGVTPRTSASVRGTDKKKSSLGPRLETHKVGATHYPGICGELVVVQLGPDVHFLLQQQKKKRGHSSCYRHRTWVLETGEPSVGREGGES